MQRKPTLRQPVVKKPQQATPAPAATTNPISKVGSGQVPALAKKETVVFEDPEKVVEKPKAPVPAKPAPAKATDEPGTIDFLKQ